MWVYFAPIYFKTFKMRLDRIDQNAEGLVIDQEGKVIQATGRQVDYVKRNGVHALISPELESRDRLGMTPRLGTMDEQEVASCRGEVMHCLFDVIEEELE